jgi:hypothetical protein
MSSTTPVPGGDVKTPISPKVKASTAVALLLSLLAAILNEAQTNSALLGALPDWLQGVVITLIPTVLVFLGGYSPTDRLRQAGARFTDGR